MTATTEQIAAMEARGWTWDGRRFRAESGGQPSHMGTLALWAMVRRFDGGWMAKYGFAGHDCSPAAVVHPTPEPAADEAEAWLRGVLAGFRFPWLRVDPRTPANTAPRSTP